jgi:hypothetical protein
MDSRLSFGMKHNLGFLFQSKVSTVKQFEGMCRKKIYGEYPLEGFVFVKYLSAILHPRYDDCIGKLIGLLNENAIQIFKLALSQVQSTDSEDGVLRTGGGGIKHPYIAFLKYDSFHTVFVMADMGDNLLELIETSPVAFRNSWVERLSLLTSFRNDVVQSTLNMVQYFFFCHNDICSPNIAMQG